MQLHTNWRCNWQVDLLSIDAEGHDGLVLRGAARLLAERRVRLVEVTPHDKMGPPPYK